MNTNTPPEFVGFPKIARLSREVIITEKIDGTNAQIVITEDGDFFVGSRTRWITPESDNHGFAKWAYGNKNELMKLGSGRHFGEWWGCGIQRGYGISEKRLSLFNVKRWCLYGETPKQIETQDPRIVKMQDVLPECVGLVPVLRVSDDMNRAAESAINQLRMNGSLAAPGYTNPEGIIIFHTAGNVCFKKTIQNDGQPKSIAA